MILITPQITCQHWDLKNTGNIPASHPRQSHHARTVHIPLTFRQGDTVNSKILDSCLL